MNINKKAVGYVRVSTKEQGEHGYSLEAQKEMIENYCRQFGYELVNIYEDKGISGKSMKGRLAFKKLMEDGKNGKFDVIIVWKTSKNFRWELSSNRTAKMPSMWRWHGSWTDCETTKEW